MRHIEQYVPSLSRAWNRATKKRLRARERQAARRLVRLLPIR